MYPHFSRLPADKKSSIEDAIAALQRCVSAEAEQVFAAIIQDYGHLHIYTMGLYFSAGSWSYLLPTFSSEEGLAKVAAHYAKHSSVDIEQQKQSLRWSPCDSPHHCDDELGAIMSGTDRLLEDLQVLIDNQDPDLAEDFDGEFEDYAAENDPRENFYELVAEIHELIHRAVVEALKSIAQLPAIATFVASQSCLITLSAGDQSEEEFLQDLQQINGDTAFVKAQQDLKQADEVRELDYKLQAERLAYERLHPPTTQLTLADFSDIIAQFSPDFFEQDGGIFVKRNYPYNLTGDSQCEVSANRFELMKLLENSPHYPELDKLYGHFIGINFQTDDLLPSICRALVVQLGESLKQKYPKYPFSIYMSVERMSLYYFCFHLKRNDGYQYTLMSSLRQEQGGVEEVYDI